MKRHALAILTTLLVLTVGLPFTQANEAKTRGKQGDLLTPLAIGNSWVYEGDEDDLVTTDRIEGVVLFDGQPWHLLRSYEREVDQPEEMNTSLQTDLLLSMIDGHECDAFIEMGQDDENFGVMQLSGVSRYYRYPATLGESYKPSADDPGMSVTVIALNEKVKTEAGEFECVVYQETSTDDEDYSFTSYVCPGIGIVKNITVDADGTYVSKLVSYTLVEED